MPEPLRQGDSLADYDYELPVELIAQEPVSPRDHSRLMVIDRARGLTSHHRFDELPRFIENGDFLVANNSKVLKARLVGRRLLSDGSMGGKVEFVMLELMTDSPHPHVWEGLFHASAKYVRGLKFWIPTPDGKGLVGSVVRGSSENDHGTIEVSFDRDPVLSGAGSLPLPHYIDRIVNQDDDFRYQTIYAKELGSAAAPTAGLHFTEALKSKLEAKNVGWGEVTLHVGLGTFRPVKFGDISQHQMHEEQYSVSTPLMESLKQARAQRKRIIAIGTTTARTLETLGRKVFSNEGTTSVMKGRTSIFIRPGNHDFQVINGLITNFHLPKSTLLMLVSAFAGRELIKQAYAEAIQQRYRFYSYGDAMLIL